MKILYVVVPCYNEEEIIEQTADIILIKLRELEKNGIISIKSKVLFVDDGSIDSTWEKIAKIHKFDNKVAALRFAQNRGHQNAIFAGLMFAKEYSDICITIDSDLQQDINAIDKFIAENEKGCDIVYGIRNSRDTDSILKKVTGKLFYQFMHMMGSEIYENSADYRLMNKKAMIALSEYKEVNLFLRGLIIDIGLQRGIVHFDVFPRKVGKPKYSIKKSVCLAIDGITSFSVCPIHFVCVCGVFMIVISILMIIFCLIDYFTKNYVPGYPTLLCSIWFIGGVTTFSIGVIGEYVGRSYKEAKHRPKYFLRDILYE